MTEKFQAHLVYLVPVLASLSVGLACAYLLWSSSIQTLAITPFTENSAAGSFSNAFYFLIAVALGGAFFYFLIRRKKERILKTVIAFALTTASLLLSIVYLSALFAFFPNIPYPDLLLISISILITILFDLAIFRLGSKARNTAVICIGGALGMFFGASIPLFSAVLILAFLAIYDIYAVYRGPVGKIAKSGIDELNGLTFSFKDIQMGLGDLAFYSMLTGAILFNYDVIPCIISIVGILAGAYLTFKMLEKKGIFPGLPFPIFLGLAAGILTALII